MKFFKSKLETKALNVCQNFVGLFFQILFWLTDNNDVI